MKNKSEKKILVIGGSGFMGRNLIFKLIEEGYKVKLLDLIKPNWLNNKIEFIEGNFLHEHIVDEAIHNCFAIYHLASTTLPKTSNEDPVFDINTNLAGTIQILQKCITYKTKKIIFTSSGGTIYGIPDELPTTEKSSTNPICSYGIVKLAIEKYLKLYHKLYGMDTCSLRISNPYGYFQRHDKGQGVISVFCKSFSTGKAIEIWGKGNIKKDFIYIDDLMEAMIKPLEIECNGEEINIGGGESFCLNEIINFLQNYTKKEIKINYLPSKNFDVQHTLLDISKAKDILHWEPKTDFYDGLKKTYDWIKNSPQF